MALNGRRSTTPQTSSLLTYFLAGFEKKVAQDFRPWLSNIALEAARSDSAATPLRNATVQYSPIWYNTYQDDYFSFSFFPARLITLFASI